MKNTNVLRILTVISILFLHSSCGGIKICTPADPCDCYTIRDGNLAFVNCNPIPIPSPTAIPTPSPSPSSSPTPIPTPIPTPSPSISPSPSPSSSPTPVPSPTNSPGCGISDNCSLYKPTNTGLAIHVCTLKNRQICGKPLNVECNFKFPVDAVCSGDSTPRYNGELPCWKTCRVERCEYPPKSKCGATTDWWAEDGVILIPESDGYGAKLKFPKAGRYAIRACRDGRPDLCTTKEVQIQ